MAEWEGSWKNFVSCLLLLGVASLAYANTFGHPWVYDDMPVIVNNPDVTSWQAFLRDVYPGRPLRELTYLLDRALFGMNPAGWHIQQILWHGLNGCLVFALGRQLQLARGAALLAALLFLLHPLQVEVVGHLSHRKDLLTTTFALGSLQAYATFFTAFDRRRWGWLALTVLLAGLAYAGKQTAAALPLVFAAYELAFVTPSKRLLLRWPSLFASAAAAMVAVAAVWFFAFGGLTAYRKAYVPWLVKFNLIPPFTDAEYLQMLFKSWAFMLRRLVWPVDLAPEYVLSAPVGWLDPWVLAGLAMALLIVTSLTLLYVTGQKQLGFSLAWFAGFFLITANLLWPLAYLAADRYLYTPMVGFCLIIALLLWRLCRQRAAYLLPVASALCLVLGVLTWQQNQVWASHEALWRHSLQVSPQSFTALNDLGKVHMDRGDYAAALKYYLRAAAINYSAPGPRYNLGLLYDKQGDRSRALSYFKEYLARADISTTLAHERLAKKVRNHVRKKYGVSL